MTCCEEITDLLLDVRDGDPGGHRPALLRVYEELRRIAQAAPVQLFAKRAGIENRGHGSAGGGARPTRRLHCR